MGPVTAAELQRDVNLGRTPVSISGGGGQEEPGQKRITARLFAVNTLVQFANPGLRALVGIGLTALLTRRLGVEGYGEYSLVQVYVLTFWGIFNEWGLGTICLREISRHPQRQQEVLSSSVALQALAALFSFCLVLASLTVAGYSPNINAAIAVYSLTLLLSPIDVLALPFHAQLRLTSLLVPTLVGTALSALLTTAAVLARVPLFGIMAAAVGALLIQYVWVAILARRLAGPLRWPNLAQCGWLLREAWPLTAGTVAATVLQQAPAVALSRSSVEAVGLYNAAGRVPQQLMVIPMALRASTFPLLSSAWVKDRAQFRVILERLAIGSMTVAVLIAVAGVGLAGPITRVLLGSQFAAADASFALLTLAYAVTLPGMVFGEGLTAAGLQRHSLVIHAVGAVGMVALLAFAAPAFGAPGAACARLACQMLVAVASWWVLRSKLGASLRLSSMLLPVAAASAGGAGLVIGGWLALSPLFVTAVALAMAGSVATAIGYLAGARSARGFLRILAGW